MKKIPFIITLRDICEWYNVRWQQLYFFDQVSKFAEIAGRMKHAILLNQ